MREESVRYLIAVGLDGSNSSWKALDEAIQQSLQKQASLHVISIQEHAEASYNASEVLAVEKTSREKLEAIQLTAKRLLQKNGIEAVMAIVAGAPASGLANYVKKNGVNLLVVGDTGHSSIWGALLGTTAEKIVRSAICSVLIVR